MLSESQGGRGSDAIGVFGILITKSITISDLFVCDIE